MTTATRVSAHVAHPVPKSKTRRATMAQDARQALARYRNLLKYEGTEHEDHTQRVLALLWAQAHIESALFTETQGRIGHQMSSPSRILNREDVPHPSPAETDAAERAAIEANRHG